MSLFSDFHFFLTNSFFLPQIELDNTGFGNDLESTRDAIDYHKEVHAEIIHFQNRVEQCIAQRVSNMTLTGEKCAVKKAKMVKLGGGEVGMYHFIYG